MKTRLAKKFLKNDRKIIKTTSDEGDYELTLIYNEEDKIIDMKNKNCEETIELV